MTIDKKVLEQLFEGFDAKLVSEELKEKVRQMVDDTVNTRVSAMTQELEEKEKLALAEVKKVKRSYAEKAKKLEEDYTQREKILEEEAKIFAENVSKALREKESIMMEEVEAYRNHVEQVVSEEAKSYRDYLEQVITEEADNYRNYLEEIALEEAVSYRKEQEAALAEEVGAFKGEMVDKISEFFEAELTKNIPEEIMEAAVKLEAYEPLVEKIINVFGESYIKLDTTSYDVIKEARKENEKLSEAVNTKTKENVRLQNMVHNLQKEQKIAELTEGMTQAQKSRARELLEGYNVAEVEDKFNKVRDIIIESSVKSGDENKKTLTENDKKSTKSSSKKGFSETAQRKIEKLQRQPMTESQQKDPEMSEYVARLNRQLRT